MGHTISEGSNIIILEAIAAIQSEFVGGAKKEKLYDLVLSHLLLISESEHVYLGDFVSLSGGQKQFRRVWSKQRSDPPLQMTSRQLFATLTKVVPNTFLNDLVYNNDLLFRKGCPEEKFFLSKNRSVIKNFVGVPLVYRKKLLGAVILLNSQLFDYYPLIFTLLKPLFESCAGLLQSQVLVRSKKSKESRLAFLAENDALTKLPNRSVFNDRLQHGFERAQRRNALIGLMYLDIDHFKQVNDTLGHDAGDQLLIEVANRIKKSIRCEDTLSRIGGDEFTVILEELNSLLDAGRVADKIFKNIQAPIKLNNIEHYIGLSVGIAVEPSRNIDVDTIIKHADMAMYDAKKHGRNNYKFYTKELNARNKIRLSLSEELEKAQNNHDFYMVYQPQLKISNNQVVGCEALLRWRNHGKQGPDVFVPVLEDTGLIVPVGQWIIEDSCRQHGVWFKKHLLNENFKVSIKLSPRQFYDPDIIRVVKNSLSNSQLNPKSLIFEISESTLIRNDEHCKDIMFKLKDLGVAFSVDDFGMGYLSLKSLKTFPVSHLKIDRSFINGVIKKTHDASICSAIISIAQKMNILVTAEGVENTEQLEFLKHSGCHFYQGYLFSKPLGANKAARFLRVS